MKKLLGLLLVVISAMTLLIGCLAKDGIQGPPGKDGTDGTNGIAGTTSCLKCHSDSNWALKSMQYDMSKHSYGNTRARAEGNRFCMRCHGNEGFQEITQNNMPWAASENPDATKIQCETCHKMSGFNFSGDTVSEIMRTTAPVISLYLNQATLNGWTTTTRVDNTITSGPDSGSKINNMCITCHQIRGATSFTYLDSATSTVTKNFAQLAYFPIGTRILPSSPAINNRTVSYTSGTTTITGGSYSTPAFTGDTTYNQLATDSVAYMDGRSFSVHDGNQSNVLYGRYAYDFGTPITTSPRHHANAECVSCHMNAFNAVDSSGGHTLKVNLNDVSCQACHHLPDTIKTTVANTDTLLNRLGWALVNRHLAKAGTYSSTTGLWSFTLLTTHDFYGKLHSKLPADSAAIYAGLTAWNTTDTTTGAIKYRNRITYSTDANYAYRAGRKLLYGELGAMYNYGFFSGFNGEISVHNDEYTRKVLQASIDWLNSH